MEVCRSMEIVFINCSSVFASIPFRFNIPQDYKSFRRKCSLQEKSLHPIFMQIMSLLHV